MHPTHPSTEPGAIIGYRTNGTPIRLQAGGAPEDGDGDAGDGQGATGDAGSQGSNPTMTAALAQVARAHRQDKAAALPAHHRPTTQLHGPSQPSGTTSSRSGPSGQAAEKRLADLEAARAKDAEDVKQRNLALAKALGLPGSEDRPDPEKLAAELAAERQAKQAAIDQSASRERELTIELQLLRQAAKIARTRSCWATPGP